MLRNKQNIQCFKHSIANILLFVFLFVMFYFIIYESVNTIHDCSGEDCPICHELHIASTFTKQVTSAIVTAIGCFFLIVFAQSAKAVISCSKSERNLVIDKVRIDD